MLNVAHEPGTDDVQCAGFRGQDRVSVEIAQHQGANAQRVADPDKLFVGQRHQSITTLDLAEHVDEAIDELGPP